MDIMPAHRKSLSWLVGIDYYSDILAARNRKGPQSDEWLCRANRVSSMGGT